MQKNTFHAIHIISGYLVSYEDVIRKTIAGHIGKLSLLMLFWRE
jgi:hypothetical protein